VLVGTTETYGSLQTRREEVDEATMEQVIKALSELAVPLVKADGGELYVVSVTGEDVHVHLAGTCAGCPGATITRERLLEPTVRGVSPKLTVKVTTGWRVPEGATKVE
jgi:Fe-S cluster biogenesis protein NfuA